MSKPKFAYVRVEVGEPREDGCVPCYPVNTQGITVPTTKVVMESPVEEGHVGPFSVGLAVARECIVNGSDLVSRVKQLIREGKA